MKPKALVVTTVHWPDDTRIRERLIRTLAEGFDVRYATRDPGPTDRSDLEWVRLPGGRLRRNLGALRLALTESWDVLVVHDPELIPVALMARLKGRPVVLDVHENIPATARTRDWVPEWLRTPLSAFLSFALRIVEPLLTVTLAESGYRRLFRRDHPVFPNHPDTRRYPDPIGGVRVVVYLGDVTVQRGARVAVEASAGAGVPIVFIGRAGDDLRAELAVTTGEGHTVDFRGELPNPVALNEARRAGVGISPLLDSPNYRDSAPTKVLEYLALGLPVVASDLPGTRELVEGLDAVELVTPGDPTALARAIERALQPSSRATAAAQAREVRERFRWPAEEVLEFYRSLI